MTEGSTPTDEQLLADGFTPEQVAAIDKRANAALDAASVDAAREKQYVDALLVEREGYARFGRIDRVAEVDAELERRGHKAAAQARSAAAPTKPRGRRQAATEEA